MDPNADDFEMEAWPFYWVARVNRLYNNTLDELLKKVDLDVARWRVLMMLEQEGYCSVSRLAKHSALKLSTMTKTVQRLQRDEMVVTRTKSTDARVTEVGLTKKGSDILSRARKAAGFVYQDAFSDFEPDEVTQLITAMKRLHQNLDVDF